MGRKMHVLFESGSLDGQEMEIDYCATYIALGDVYRLITIKGSPAERYYVFKAEAESDG